MSIIKTIGNYEFNPDNWLGSGSFASVYRGRHRITKEQVAIKEINVKKLKREHNDLNVEKIMRCIGSEIRIMKTLQHQNIIELKDVTLEGDTVYMVLEYCSGGDIVSYMRMRRGKSKECVGIGEENAQHIASQIMKGLKHMHSFGIVHRDLKPQNILLSKTPPTSDNCSWNDVFIKIADFGFARTLETSQMTETMCGSPLYMAPEVLNSQKYTDIADLWSFGVILYEMLVGVPPFTARNIVELSGIFKTSKEINIPAHVSITKECKDLILSLLVVDSTKRISWDAFFDHPWFIDKSISRSVIAIPITSHSVNESFYGSAPPRMQSPTNSMCINEELLRSFEIINDYSRNTIMIGEPSTTVKSNDDINFELQQWIERIHTLVNIGNLNMDNNCYIVGQKFFMHAMSVIKVVLDTTDSYVSNNLELLKETDASIKAKLTSEIDLRIVQLKKLLEQCTNNADACKKHCKPTDTCKSTEKLVFDKAISLGKQGKINTEIDNDRLALENYSTGVHLFETLSPFSNSDGKEIISRYVATYNKRLQQIKRKIKENYN